MASCWVVVTAFSLLIIGCNGSEPFGTQSGSLLDRMLEERVQRTRLTQQLQQLRDKNRALEQKLNNVTAEISNIKMQVAFSARLNSNHPSSEFGQIVRFDHVTSNTGNAYSTTTGIFRCPVSGLYLFSCNVLGDYPNSLILSVYKNGIEIARPYAGGGGTRQSGSDTTIVHANAGDEVYTKVIGGGSQHMDHYSRFSGILLKAD